MSVRWLFLLGLVLACDKATEPPAPVRHEMIGTYDIRATFTTYTIPGPVVTTVNATFTGTIIVGDTTVYDSTTAHYSFPDVRVDGTFCQAPGTCSTPQSWTTTTATGPGLPVLLDLAHVFRLEGPYTAGVIAGSALYIQGTDSRNQYSGTFTATKR